MSRRSGLKLLLILTCVFLPGLAGFPGCPTQEGTGSAAPQPEATINVSAGNAAGLIAAIYAANGNGQTDTIVLAVPIG